MTFTTYLSIEEIVYRLNHKFDTAQSFVRYRTDRVNASPYSSIQQRALHYLKLQRIVV